NKHSVLMPFSRLEFFHRKFIDDPWLSLGVDDHFFARMSQNPPPALFVEHAVVVRPIGNDVALIARDNTLPQIGPVLAAIIQTAIPAGSDFHLHAQLEILQRAAAPNDEAVVPQRAVRYARQAAVLDAPIVGAAFPTGEILAVEDRDKSLRGPR